MMNKIEVITYVWVTIVTYKYTYVICIENDLRRLIMVLGVMCDVNVLCVNLLNISYRFRDTQFTFFILSQCSEQVNQLVIDHICEI